MTRDARLRLAAERVLKACGPVLDKARRDLDGQPSALMSDPLPVEEVDEARGALMDLEKALKEAR